MSGGIDGAAVPDHPLVGIITALFLRPGSVPAQDDAEWHRRRIAWEWQSNQWVMEVDRAGRLWGWLAYYRVSGALLDALSTLQLDALRGGNPWEQLTGGEHLYLSTAMVAPWAPADTLTHLARCARERNRDAVTASWHHRYPDGRSRFVQVPIDWEF